MTESKYTAVFEKVIKDFQAALAEQATIFDSFFPTKMEDKFEKVYTIFHEQTVPMLHVFVEGCDQAAQVLNLSFKPVEQETIEREIKSKQNCYRKRLEGREVTITSIRNGVTNSNTVDQDEVNDWCRKLIAHTVSFRISLEARKYALAKKLGVGPYRIK